MSLKQSLALSLLFFTGLLWTFRREASVPGSVIVGVLGAIVYLALFGTITRAIDAAASSEMPLRLLHWGVVLGLTVLTMLVWYGLLQLPQVFD